MSDASPPAPPPLTGWRLYLALVWLGAVVLLHLVVRELGLRVVP
jgi:hypothetical protein